MRTLPVVIAAAMLTVAMPVPAKALGHERHDDQNFSPGEVERSPDRLQNEREDLRHAERLGRERDVSMEQRDVDRARQEYLQDAEDWRNSDKRRCQESCKSSADWNRGNRYGWDRPEPRCNGSYANNEFRSGTYRDRQLGANDRIYRGNDNRYYCRRNDASTGLINGAIGGVVLGNVIVPGGSKRLGAILGGSLGAILGESIDTQNVTCR